MAFLKTLWDRAAARLADSRFNPSRKPFRDHEKVSLGDGYIWGRDANRLARMAREAESDTRARLTLAGMTPEQRAAILSVIPSPFQISLGEMTRDEMFSHLKATSDYNLARERE